MKLAAARVEPFLLDPGDCQVVLLYGDDAGMIRERGAALVRAVAGARRSLPGGRARPRRTGPAGG